MLPIKRKQNFIQSISTEGKYPNISILRTQLDITTLQLFWHIERIKILTNELFSRAKLVFPISYDEEILSRNPQQSVKAARDKYES